MFSGFDMARVIAFANQKGGVGKTTLSMQAAFYYALKKKKRVLFIDMDKQANSTRLLLGPEDQLDPADTKSYQLFEPDLEDLVVHETKRGIDLIGATLDHQTVMDQVLAVDDDILVQGKTIQLPQERINLLREAYDYIILDCQPELATALVASLIAADYVVSPLKLSGLAMDGLTDMSKTLARIKENWNENVTFLGLVINDFDKTGNQKRSVKAVREILKDDVFKTILQHRSPYDMAMTGGEGVPIWEIKNGKAAAEEMASLFKELDQRIKKAEEARA